MIIAHLIFIYLFSSDNYLHEVRMNVGIVSSSSCYTHQPLWNVICYLILILRRTRDLHIIVTWPSMVVSKLMKEVGVYSLALQTVFRFGPKRWLRNSLTSMQCIVSVIGKVCWGLSDFKNRTFPRQTTTTHTRYTFLFQNFLCEPYFANGYPILLYNIFLQWKKCE